MPGEKAGSVSPPGVQPHGDGAKASLNGSEPQMDSVPVPKSPAAERQASDVDMQDGPELAAKTPELPPLPPVSFGKEATLVDVAFGRPMSGSFRLRVHPRPEQWVMLERWRTAARNDEYVSS